MALTKKLRLKDAKSISRVFRETRPRHEAGLSLRASDSKNTPTVFAVLVPTSVAARALARNALRRKVTEALRRVLRAHDVIVGKKVVLTVRSVPPIARDLEKSLVLLLNKSAILQK